MTCSQNRPDLKTLVLTDNLTAKQAGFCLYLEGRVGGVFSELVDVGRERETSWMVSATAARVEIPVTHMEETVEGRSPGENHRCAEFQIPAVYIQEGANEAVGCLSLQFREDVWAQTPSGMVRAKLPGQ